MLSVTLESFWADVSVLKYDDRPEADVTPQLSERGLKPPLEMASCMASP